MNRKTHATCNVKCIIETVQDLPRSREVACTVKVIIFLTRTSAIAEGPRDESCQLKSCQLPRNSAETTCTTSPEPSNSCRELTRATKSCCRQRLTICAINYRGRASELGGIIDLVDRRRPSLSRCERPPFSS